MKLQVSLSDRIYDELIAGLEQGVGYEEVCQHYESTKGSLYDALSRLFQYARNNLSRLSSELQERRSMLERSEAELDVLGRQARTFQEVIESRQQRLAEMDADIGLHPGELKGMSILLVSSRPNELGLMGSALKDRGFSRVAAARSFREAAAALAQRVSESPACGVDLAVVAADLPDSGAGQLCRFMRSRNELQDIPIVFTEPGVDVDSLENETGCGSGDRAMESSGDQELMSRVGLALRLRRETERRRKREAEIAKLRHELEDAHVRLERLTPLDPETGLLKPAEFDNRLRIETRRAVRGNYPLSLIKAGIDHFERARRLGVLLVSETADIVRVSARRVADFTAYRGNGEFSVALPMTDSAGASHVAHTIRSSVNALRLSCGQDEAGAAITVSLGVATARGEPGLTSSILVSAADDLLWRARRSGGDQLLAYEA